MHLDSASNGLLTIGSGIYLSKPQSTTPEPCTNLEDSTGTAHGNSMEPRLSSSNSHVASPSVILIFGWMGAKLPHLLKYIKSYDQLYPDSVKIVVRSEATFFWTSIAARRRRLQPVVEALELLGCLPPAKSCSTSVILADIQPVIPYPRPAILVHAFSNGGSWQLTTLSAMLDSRISLTDISKHPFCPSALILDSCPGNGGLKSAQRAFSAAIPNPILRAIARFAIRVMFMIMYIQTTFLRRKLNTVDVMKAQLNSAKLLPWFGENTRRLYIYSAKDDLIPYHEVEEHATQAKKNGLIVKQRRFEDSAHVAHAKAHPEVYWREVQTLWEDASSDL